MPLTKQELPHFVIFLADRVGKPDESRPDKQADDLPITLASSLEGSTRSIAQS